MKCSYCNTEIKDFTENFVYCPNDDCPHRDLPSESRKGGKTRGYTCKRDS